MDRLRAVSRRPAPMATEVRMVVRGESRTHRFLRARLTFIIGATLLLDAVASIAMYLLEHDHRASGFHDLGGAVFWVSAQLTTVSSQMPNPVTTGGRILDIVLEVWAITVAATLAASLAAFFRARHVEELGRSAVPGAPALAPAPPQRVPVGNDRRVQEG